MKIQGIYKIVNKINNKIYIGQSINIIRRFKQHKSDAVSKFKYPLYNAFRKYGLNNFEFIIIEEVISVQNLDLREQYWLDHYKSYLPDFGYNIITIAGSTKGYKHSNKTREKISLANKGKPSCMKGKKHTEETKRKIAESNKGKTNTKKTREKMSLAKKGNIPWNKGKKLTKEHIQKLSLRKKGKKRKPFTKETIENIRKAALKRWVLHNIPSVS